MTPESSDRSGLDFVSKICVILMIVSSVGGAILMALQSSGVIK